MHFVAALIASSFALAASGAAEEPSPGLVLSLSGSTTPPIAAMSEIPAGAPLELAPGAELTFLHYAKCKLVTVSGGILTLTRTDFSTDGNIVNEKDGPCPRIHQLHGNTSGMVSGGLVMRGVNSVPRWPLNREIIIAGSGTDALNSASIFAEGRIDTPLVRLDVSGHQVRYPTDAPPLAANEHYVLRLTMAGRAEPIDILFIGAPPTGPNLLVIVR